MSINYRVLLIKYMSLVCDEEHCTYVDRADCAITMPFTEEEIKELQKIQQEPPP